MRIFWIILVIMGTATPVSLAAPPAAEDLVKTELLADVASIEPGRPFTIGVRFRIEPGWHIYWTNPGDSGEATRVEFKALEGFKVGPVRFPVPVKFDQPGDIVGYGYHDEVLITAIVSPLANFSPGTSHTIVADITYLVCEKVCIPGKARLELKLPVEAMSHPANSPLFSAAHEATPVAAAAIGVNTTQSLNWDKHELSLTIDWPQAAPAKAQWFPPAADDVIFSNARITSSGKRTVVTFSFSSLARKIAEPKLFESVLAYDAGNGVRRGIRVPFELKSGE